MFREQKGWSQKELAEKAQIDASLISRLEAGLYVNPRATTTAKLEAALGVTPGSLESRSKAGGDESEQPIKFLIPHSTVSALFFPLALGGEIEGVQFASCRRSGPAGDFIWLPTEDGVAPDTNPSNIQSLLSVALRSMLDSGDGDLALLWSASLEAYEEIYKRYAQVVFGLSTLNCLRIVPKDVPKNDDCPIFYPRGLDYIVKRYKTQLASKTSTVTDFADFPRFIDQVKTALSSDGQVAIFIWEPCTSWLKDALTKEEKDKYNFELEIPMGMDLNKHDEPPLYAVMDIVCKADDKRTLQWLREERDKTRGFFARLKTSIKQIEIALKEKDFTIEPLPMIANYLHMPENEVRWRLRRLDFAVRFYD
jgi:transcriptional regulator with XRE-family HTH domain